MTPEAFVSLVRSRDASFDDASVKRCLSDADCGPSLLEWANEHLGSDTLLTLDELQQYEALQRSGRAEELTAAMERSRGSSGSSDKESGLAGGDSGFARVPLPPLKETELQSAVAVLRQSTEQIGRQTDVLRLQHEAVARLSKTAAVQRHARAVFEKQQSQRVQAGRSALAADVARLSRDLDERIAQLEQQGLGAAGRMRQTVDDLCRSDDKLLASLQKLGRALGTCGGGEDDDEQERLQKQTVLRLRDLCLQLIKHTTEAVRARLGRLYLETVLQSAGTAVPAGGKHDDSNDDGDGGGDDVEEEEARTAVDELQNELESLYTEILPVAQMSVENQYLEPALRLVSGKQNQKIEMTLLALDYINECLEFLLEHISLLTERVKLAHAHLETTATFVGIAQSELAVPTVASRKTDQQQQHQQQEQQRKHTHQGSPSYGRRRKSSGASAGSPVRPRGRRRSSGVGGRYSGDGSALDHLLEGLALVLPAPDDDVEVVSGGGGSSSSSNGGAGPKTSAVDGCTSKTGVQENARYLQAVLADRTAKADGVASNAQTSFEAATTAQLSDMRSAIAVVRESLLAESPFGTVQLADPEIDASIAVMAQEVDNMRARLARVVRELDGARGRSAKRDQLVARWGS